MGEVGGGLKIDGRFYEALRLQTKSRAGCRSRLRRAPDAAAGLEWKSLYAGRRGAGTARIGLTNGNYAAAQELLRHKHMSTTLNFYKKQTESALEAGMQALQDAANRRSLGEGDDK